MSFVLLFCEARTGSSATMKLMEEMGIKTAKADSIENRESSKARDAFWDYAKGISRLKWDNLVEEMDRLHGRWSIKLPAHVCHTNAILQEYPDAKFVFLFRDPAAIAKRDLTVGGKRQTLNGTLDRYREMLTMYTMIQNHGYLLSYEKLLMFPERELSDLSRYLGVAAEVKLIAQLVQPERGYTELRAEP